MGCGACKSNAKAKTLRRKYEVEGFKGRVVRLFHVTSPEALRSIVRSDKMFRGSDGMFGGGIYFATTLEIAFTKAQSAGAVVEAEVMLGYSLVCRESMPNMTYTRLKKSYGCDSVKGQECVSNPEYVVYNWAQVTISAVQIGCYRITDLKSVRRNDYPQYLKFPKIKSSWSSKKLRKVIEAHMQKSQLYSKNILERELLFG